MYYSANASPSQMFVWQEGAAFLLTAFALGFAIGIAEPKFKA
jgi:hypothetical protein